MKRLLLILTILLIAYTGDTYDGSADPGVGIGTHDLFNDEKVS